jgi:hypothetical protein
MRIHFMINAPVRLVDSGFAAVDNGVSASPLTASIIDS